ncbi:MAG: hypothetical protein COT00_01340 [Candidatus Omnitrophica bacterium CG07_land_8_20_14_0_80_50_8]|nr:MAG: hypothetical protein COT00_01340 [Candidatus Omnitrophica bacterium CG07_land_8_20_14_0_80_50_8]
MSYVCVRGFIILLFVVLVSGCGSLDKKDLNTVTVWHWMSDRESVFQALANRFENETHIKVKFELYAPSESYAQKVKAAAQTDTLPDIFAVLGEKRDLASFIKSGAVADLTGALNKPEDGGTWKSQFFEKALAVNEFLPDNEYGIKAGIYGVSIDVAAIQMLYNRKLYRKAGLDPDKPPQTWEEFLEHCKTLKENGIPCFVGYFGEIWAIDALASNYAMNLMGEDKYFKTFEGKVPYTDPDWVRVLSLFKELADERILVDGAVTMVSKSAEQTFANERAAYTFNGSWCVHVYKGMNPDLDYGAMLPPRLSKEHPMKVWGGGASSFVVNDQSFRRANAIQFLKWLTKEKQQSTLAAETENLPANKKSLGKLSKVLAEFADDIRYTTHPNVFPVHEDPEVTVALDKGIQSILIGEKTPEQIAQAVQRVKEKVMKKSHQGQP